MSLVKIQTNNSALPNGNPATFFTTDTAASVSAITVKNIGGFLINQILLIGGFGNEGSEIINTSTVTAPSGFTVTLASATIFPHSADTPINVLNFDQVEFSTALTTVGVKTVLATVNILPGTDTTTYDDTSGATGYYYSRYKNSITGAFSSYSAPIPVQGYSITTARSIIDNALAAINQVTSDTLPDTFFFNEMNNFQYEVLRELKRWSWMQSFSTIIGQSATGTWRVAVPTDLDDQNTSRDIYNFKLGNNFDMTWVDKEKWDSIIQGVSYSTLAAPILLNDATVTLTNSGDFSDGGVLYIGANTYGYTANNRTTNVITLTDLAATTAPIDSDVFEGAALGLPTYWTTYGGYLYHYPVTAREYTQRNYYLDYYMSLTRIISDADSIVVPDAAACQYFLEWKALKRLANGAEDEAALSAKANFMERKNRLVSFETNGRTLQLRPRLNSMGNAPFQYDDDERVRDGAFANI